MKMSDLIGSLKEDLVESSLSEHPEIIRKLTAQSQKRARDLLTYEIAAKLNVLPLEVEFSNSSETIVVASKSSCDPQLSQTLAFITDRRVRLVAVEAKILPKAIFTAYMGDGETLLQNINRSASETTLFERKRSISVLEPKAQRTEDLLRNGDARAARILRALLEYSIARGASDLHIFPEEGGARASLRLNGLLYTHESKLCDHYLFTNIVSLVKVLAGLNTTIKRRAQDGSFVYKLALGTTNIRVSIMPIVYGEKIVLRILGNADIKEIKDLQLHWRTENFLETFAALSDGLGLFAGPTGSGKSTTMYSLVNELKKRNMSISTIENPVEVFIPGIAQTEIDETQGMDFASSLKSILRQDPDIILVGEIRDRGSAEAAVQATQTGHLIISTIHGRNAFDCVKRLQSLGIDPLTLSDSLKLIIFQRLIPRLCDHCKVPNLPISKLATKYRDLEIKRMYQPGSCVECNYSGFNGRVPITESLRIDSEIVDRLSMGNFDRALLKPYLNSENYSPLEESLRSWIEKGVVSPEHIAI